MMRSLFSGVAGLKSHQTRMDSIGNNIANVNTTGYKSSRVTFADTLYQTSSGASAPTDTIGGTNPKQIGLGTGVASIDTIFTDGSTQSTGKNTDLAITGSGLFAVKSGKDTYYTRDGAFEFDADGNYVLPGSGMYVQGWMGSDGTINTSAATTNISVQAGKSMPSKATATITYSNNLNAAAATIASIKITGADGSTITIPSTSTTAYKIGDSVSETIASEAITFSDGSTVSSASGTYAMKTSYPITAMTATLADGSTVTVDTTSTSIYMTGKVPASTISSLSGLSWSTADTITLASGASLTSGTAYSQTISSVSGSGPYTLTLADGTTVSTSTAYTAGSTYTNTPTFTGGTLADGSTFTIASGTAYKIGSALTSKISSMTGSVNGDTFTAGSGAIVPSSGLTASGIKLTTSSGTIVDVSSSDTGSYTKGGTYKTTINSMTLTMSDETTQSITSGTSAYTMGTSMPVTTTATVYDSLGNAHNIPILLTKTAANTWIASLGKTSITETDGTTTTLTMDDATLKFTTSGKYESGSATLSLAYGNGAAAQTVAVKLADVTQYSGTSTVKTEADGNAAGTLKSVAIDSKGIITGTYTNGVKQSEAQVAIAQFNNPGGLTKNGSSLYAESNNSGTANIKTASDLGVTLTPSALEMSNVDVANEFSDMIITQRGFQANSKIITVGDDMLETLINMKR